MMLLLVCTLSPETIGHMLEFGKLDVQCLVDLLQMCESAFWWTRMSMRHSSL